MIYAYFVGLVLGGAIGFLIGKGIGRSKQENSNVANNSLSDR